MDRILHRWLLPLLFFAPYVTVLSAVDGLRSLGGSRHFAIVWIFFLVVPTLELIFGRDTSNLDESSEERLRQSKIFKVVTWGWVPVALTVTGWTLWVIATKEPTALQFIGLTLTNGFINGIVSIVFAHELMHRSSKFERALSEILLTLVSYTHFCIEHVLGHHFNVATRNDPATARYGESFYRFLPRVMKGEFVSAWQIERERQIKRGRSMWTWRNRALRYVVTLAVIYIAITVFAGWQGFVWFALQSFVGMMMLALVNYLEHYGLERREIAPGRYEPVKPWHSWDSYHRVTNFFLLNLGRHSDHHMRAGRPYQILRSHSDAGKLPFGYVTLMIMVLIPPLWFKVMNPRARELRALGGNPLP